jgi:hypothetical protein
LGSRKPLLADQQYDGVALSLSRLRLKGNERRDEAEQGVHGV